MNIIQVLILSVVEGVTEFLPVSSTFHLIVVSKLLGVAQNDFAKLFEVFIQAGAILSAVIIYYQTLIRDRELMKKTLVSFLPTAIIGLVLYKIIKGVFFESQFLMIAVFIGFGFVFLLIEYLVKRNDIKLHKQVKNLSYSQAVIVGLVQSLAVVPGVSRAGAVIIAMMLLGYKRDESARYSFILSIPTIFAASFYDLYKMREVAFANTHNIGYLLLGFIGAFVSSYFVIKWLIGYLQKNSLTIFGWYRIALGIIILLVI